MVTLRHQADGGHSVLSSWRRNSRRGCRRRDGWVGTGKWGLGKMGQVYVVRWLVVYSSSFTWLESELMFMFT